MVPGTLWDGVDAGNASNLWWGLIRKIDRRLPLFWVGCDKMRRQRLGPEVASKIHRSLNRSPLSRSATATLNHLPADLRTNASKPSTVHPLLNQPWLHEYGSNACNMPAKVARGGHRLASLGPLAHDRASQIACRFMLQWQPTNRSLAVRESVRTQLKKQSITTSLISDSTAS